jgi:hypothetical protein
LRYLKVMTGLLQKALRRIEVLSEEEQNAIATQILESLDDEEAWARKLRERPDLLRSLAREAVEEHRRGDTRPLDETTG